MIENRIYSSRVFRKLHLELATRQDGLQVMHMVMFPRCVRVGGSVCLRHAVLLAVFCCG